MRAHSPIVQAFRYTVELGGEKLSLSLLWWDGRDLVAGRLIVVGHPPLFPEFQRADATAVLRVRLFGRSKNNPPLKGEVPPLLAEWLVAFKAVKDMGFLSIAATDDRGAVEAVRLVDAEIIGSRRAADDGGLLA